MTPDILTINGGSSSIKLAVFAAGEPPRRRLTGDVDRLGADGPTLTLTEQAASDTSAGPVPRVLPLSGSDRGAMVGSLLDRLAEQKVFSSIGAVGHRVVHGMHHSAPEIVTPELLDELRRLGPYDPDHLPLEIELIEAFRQCFPALPQVACFDTAFHRTLPRVARMLPLPRRLEALGVQRYGFHGLSYEYLLEELARVAGPEAARGRVILAHLGSGASLAAVQHGRGVDTSMGFTPTSGLMMGTRSGDLDPGLVSFLQQNQGMSAERFATLVNRESGLLGVSEVSSDMRDLLAREATDVRAAEAIELFCYQARKGIGAFAAVLGGLDTLVFSAGIGENCPPIRARICAGLGFLGVELDQASNAASAERISTPGGRVAVYVLKTDEERMIARSVRRVLVPRAT
jgi:acetate kinase